MQERRLPEELMKLIDGYNWHRVTIGRSESQTYRLTGTAGSCFLKMHAANAIERLCDERSRLEWLQGRLPVPKVLYYGVNGWGEYLLMSEAAGLDASNKMPDLTDRQLMRLLGEGLRAVHEIPIRSCPFDRTLDAVLPEAGRRVRLGLVDEDDFDSNRKGMQAEALYEELLLKRPFDEDLVFTHGDYCLPNIIVNEGRISSFIDWGRGGIADRYQDIALAVRSIANNFGEEQIPAFMESYGMAEPDLAKIEYYKLLDEFF
ncbi:Aminoglycoside 3'-phosphotransferase [compost metagenome]